MKVTEGIGKFVNDITLGKDNSFLNSTLGGLLRGFRLRDLREFFVGLLTPKISYDRKGWLAAIYRPIATRVKTGLSKLGIRPNPGPRVELFPEAIDPTPEEAKQLAEPAAFARFFSLASRKSIPQALNRLKAYTNNDSLEFLSNDESSSPTTKLFFNKLPEWVKKHTKDGVFFDPATGNTAILIWDQKNKTLHASFPGTGTFDEDGPREKRGKLEQLAADAATFAGRHIPSSHKQAADLMGACKDAVESYQKEFNTPYDIGLNCYGYCHGGSLALYAGGKNKVKTYTLAGLPLNWRMQADIGEANMNHMVREGLVNHISVEGDSFSDPVTGPFKGLCKAARFLERGGLAYPRPAKFGKTYRIKWKEQQEDFINYDYDGRLEKELEKHNKEYIDLPDGIKKMVFEDFKADPAVVEQEGEMKDRLRAFYSTPKNIHLKPLRFIDWRAGQESF